MKRIIRKILSLMMLTALMTSVLAGCNQEEKKELNLYTWSGYISDEILSEFENQTGIRVNYTNFSTNEEMLTKLENAKGGDYDVIIASDYIIDMAKDEGLAAKLDKEKIPNFENIDPLYQGFFYDENNEYTVPYAPGTPLIVYNPEMVDFEITGYEDLWNPELKDNVVLMDTERVVMGITLKTLGASFNTEDTEVLKQAEEKLIELAPNIRLLSGEQSQEYLLSEEAAVGFLFTSEVVLALQGNPDLKVVYPEEGLGFGVDALFIPSAAPNSENAHIFINYLLDGEVGAQVAQFTWYLCPNKASYEYLPEDLQASLIIDTATIPESEFIMDISNEAQEIHDEAWTKFKQALD